MSEGEKDQNKAGAKITLYTVFYGVKKVKGTFVRANLISVDIKV